MRLFFLLFFFATVTHSFSQEQIEFYPEATQLARAIHFRSLYEKEGKRKANRPLRYAMYWIEKARKRGIAPVNVISQAQKINQTPEKYRAMEYAALLRNLKLCDKWGLLTEENMLRLKRGRAPRLTKGEHKGQVAAVDHIIPRSVLPKLDELVVNLEFCPQNVNASKSAKINKRAWIGAEKLYDAGILTWKEWQKINRLYQKSQNKKRAR